MHRKAFGQVESDEKRCYYLRWIHENPISENFYIGAFSEDLLVGFLAFMPQKVVGFKRTYKAAVAVSAFTDPAFQGQGIYSELVSAGFEISRAREIDFCSGYTNNPKVLALELRIGWQEVSKGVVLAYPLRCSKVLAVQFPRLRQLSPLAKPVDYVLGKYLTHKTGKKKDLSVQISSVDDFDIEYDDLAASLCTQDQYMPYKDSAFLKWKYLSRYNVFRYNIMEARKNGKLLGCIIGRPMKMKGLNGFAVVDIIAGRGAGEITALLISEMISCFGLQDRYDIVAAMVSPTKGVFHKLKRLGFKITQQNFNMIFHLTSDITDATLFRSEAWHHSWGNTDTV